MTGMTTSASKSGITDGQGVVSYIALLVVVLAMSGCVSIRQFFPPASNGCNVSIGPTQGIVVHDVPFCAYPGLVKLPDGNLLAAYECNLNKINTELSANGGATWGSRATVYSTISNYYLDAVNLALLPNGTVFLGFGLAPGSSWIGVPTYMIGTIGVGDAITWSAPVSVSTPGWTKGCFGITPVVQLANGNLLWPVWCYNNTSSGFPASSTVMLSMDGGFTWPKQVTVGSGASGRDYDESAAVVYPNGDIVMIIRQTVGNSQSGAWWRSKSTDNGITWSAPLPAVNNNIVGRPTLALLPSGALVLLGRAQIGVVSTTGYGTSWDEGLTFTHFTDLRVGGSEPGVDYYDAMSPLPDGSIAVVMAYGNDSADVNIDYRNLVNNCAPM